MTPIPATPYIPVGCVAKPYEIAGIGGNAWGLTSEVVGILRVDSGYVEGMKPFYHSRMFSR